MDRKDKKQEKKKAKTAPRKKQTKTVKGKERTRAAQKIESELAKVDEKLHKMSDLLGDLPQGICFFNKEEVIKYHNESFSVITGCGPELLKDKKLRKNQLWGGRGQKDEFKELFLQAREAGSRLTVDMLSVNSSKVGDRTWSLSLIPQKNEAGDYDGMELIIEDVTGRKPAPDDSLSNAMYAAAVHHSETQPLLENLVSVLKDYSGCSSVSILTVDRVRDRSFKADSDNRAGLWGSDVLLSPAEIDSIFKNAETLPEECRTGGGSIYLRRISECEDGLTGILKDIVINASNSYGFSSVAFVPIRTEGWIQGFIQIADTRDELRPETVGMIENVSNQLQIILEHAGLKDEMRTQREGLLKQMNERNAHLEAMSEHLKQEVSERKKAQEEMRVQRDLAVDLNEIDDLDKALSLCLDTAIRVAGMDSGGIYLVESATKDLVLACDKGISRDFRETAARYDKDSLNARMVYQGAPIYMVASELDPEISKSLDAEGIKILGSIPVIKDGNLVAVLNIASHEAGEISYSARNAVEAIAAEIGSSITRIQSRRAYTESEERYKALFARTSSPIMVIDEDGNYVDANQAALEFLECSREELLAMKVRDTLPPYLDDKWFETYRNLWLTSGTVERDYYVWGKIKVMEMTITPLQMGDRKVIFGIGKDVTEKKRVENELRKSEERYRRHFENVNDIIYSIDNEIKITDVSPSVEKVLGYKPEELIGHSIAELNIVSPESLDKAYKNVSRILSGEIIETNEYKFVHKSGDIVYVEIKGTPLYSEGKLVGAVSVARDITDRKKAEEEVRKSEEKYRTILEEMDETYYEIDAAGKFINANESLVRRFGYTKEELLGLDYKDVTRLEDVSSKVAAFSKVFQTGRPRFWQPIIGVKKDGTLIYLEDSIYPLKNEKGETVGLRGIGREVTERRLWEAALKESEEKFRRLFYQSPVGVLIVSLDGYRFVAVNEAFCNFTGYTDEELVNMSFKDITHPDSIETDLENIGKLVKGEIDQYVTDKRYIKKDGSIVWGHVSVRLIKDPAGNPLYLLPVVEDITARKKAEQDLRRSETLFKNIIEHSSETFYMHDIDYKFLYISPQVKTMTGYTVEEASEAFLELITDNPINLIARKATVKGLKTGVKQPPYLMEVMKKDGSRALLEFNETPLKDDQGNVTGMVGMARDVTVQQKAEDEIRASEQRYHKLADYSRQLNEIYISFTEASNSEELLNRIAEAVKSLTGATAVVITKYEVPSGILRVQMVSAHDEAVVKKAVEILGAKLTGMEFKVPEEIKSRMLTDIISRRRDLNIISWGSITPEQSEEIMAMAGWCGVMGLSLNYGTGLAGTAMVLLPTAAREVPDEVLKTFSYMAGLAIYKMRGEEELRTSEAKFKNIVEHIMDVFYIQDINRELIYISPQVESILGYSATEMMGGWQRFLTESPWNADGQKKWLHAFETGEKQEPYLMEFISKPGKVLRAEINESPLKDELGNVTGMVGIARDITELMSIEQELIESEAKFRSIIEASPDPIWEIDINGAFTYVSPRITDNFGIEPAELIGKSFTSLIPADKIDEVTPKFIEARETDAPVYTTQVDAVTRDERPLVLEIRATKILDNHGNLKGFRGISRDITERIKAEKALQESEEKYRSVVENANEGIFVLQDGLFKFANDRLINFSKYSREELRAMTADDLFKNIIYPEDREMIAKNYVNRLHGDAVPQQYEIRWQDKDGKLKRAAINVTSFTWEDKPAVLGFVTDVTARVQVEEALATSEEKYRTVLDDMEEFYYEMDPKGNFTFVNDAAKQIFGYSVEELSGMNYKVYTPEGHARERVIAFSEVFQTGRPRYSQPLEHIRKDGSRVIVETSILPLRNDKGEIVGFRGVGRDITARIKAEEELQKRALFLDSAYDSIIAYGPDGNIVYANESACSSRGYTREEMLQMNIRQLVPEQGLPRLEERLGKVIRQGELIFEATHIRKDGAVLPVEAYSRLINVAGKQTVISIYRDTTMRRAAENALKESEERYRLLADNSMDIIVTTGMDLGITYISPSVRYMIGRTADEIFRMYSEGRLNAGMLGLSEADAAMAVKGLRALVQDPSRTQIFELEFKHRDGFTSWAEIKMSIMRDKNGQAAGVLGVIRDITQQKKMTERLIRSDRLASLGEMAAGLAHEVNNPLTAVMGFAYLVLQNPNTPPEVKNDINSIYNEGKRAADVIKNFLIFARGRKPEKQAVFINDIIESTIRLRHSQMTKENITVLLDLAEDLPAINGDVSQLQQVFLNIMLNAEHFMYQTNKKGTLSITTMQEDNRIKIYVKDDGPGIPPEKISRVFDPFYTTKQVGEGTGLGLSICHGIISEHGGNIYAESRQGEGATFIIDLPDGN